MAAIDLCAASVVVGGELALCIGAAGHAGRHELRWEGDPRRLAAELGSAYLVGLKEMRSTVAGLLEQIDHTIAAISEEG